MQPAELAIPVDLWQRIQRYRRVRGERLGIPTIDTEIALIKLLEKGLAQAECAAQREEDAARRENVHRFVGFSTTERRHVDQRPDSHSFSGPVLSIQSINFSSNVVCSSIIGE